MGLWHGHFLWDHYSICHSILRGIGPFHLGYHTHYYKVAHSIPLNVFKGHSFIRHSFNVCGIRGIIPSFINDSGSCVFCLFILVTLVRDLSILLIFPKKHLLCSLIFLIIFLFSFYLCCNLYFHFVLFTFSLILLSSLFRWLLISFYFFFSNTILIILNFPQALF